jgi:uncharacterized membrane protein
MTDISSATLETGAGFSIGQVFERSFSILFKNLAPFLILSAVAMSPYLILYWDQAALSFAQPGVVAADPTRVFRNYGYSFAISLILGAIFKTLCEAAILFGAFQVMRGQPFQVADSLRKGLGRFWAIIGLVIVQSIAEGFGFILLIVPGLILMSMWYVALSACVVERLGPMTSLSRSAALTKGSRWKVFGLLIVLFLLGAILGGVINGTGLASGSKIVYVAGQFILQVAVVAFGSIVGVVVYHDLRVSREGIDTDRIAAVFD